MGRESVNRNLSGAAAYGNAQDKRGALSGTGFDFDMSAHLPDELADDAEAESEAVLTLSPFKYLLLTAGIDAGTGIGNGYFDRIAHGAKVDPDVSAFRSEPEGIGNQVLQDTAEL